METVETSADPTALGQESKQVMEIAQVSLTKISGKQTVGTNTIEYYSLTKGNKSLIQATTQMTLKGIT